MLQLWFGRVGLLLSIMFLFAVLGVGTLLLTDGRVILPGGHFVVDNRVRMAYETWEKDKTELEGELRKSIDAGASGEALREAIQEMKAGRYQRAQSVFKDEVRAEMAKGIEQPLRDVLRDEYWSVEVPKDYKTGDLDFKLRDTRRAEVLAKADRMGVDQKYVLDRGIRYKDPEVQRIMLEYERDMETLRPYWEIKDKVLEQYPGYAGMVTREKALRDAGKTVTNSQAMIDIHDSDLWDT